MEQLSLADWIVGFVVVGSISLALRLVMKYSVSWGFVTASDPVVDERMPTPIDYALPVIILLSGLVFFWSSSVTFVLSSACVMIASVLYWFWRSVHGFLYWKQHRYEISSAQVILLVLTNFFFYGIIGYILQNVFHLI